MADVPVLTYGWCIIDSYIGNDLCLIWLVHQKNDCYTSWFSRQVWRSHQSPTDPKPALLPTSLPGDNAGNLLFALEKKLIMFKIHNPCNGRVRVPSISAPGGIACRPQRASITFTEESTGLLFFSAFVCFKKKYYCHLSLIFKNPPTCLLYTSPSPRD